jgi:hypothetical protein
MSRFESREETVRNFLWDKKVATLPELKAALRASATMTVFRTLKRVKYLSSYSHRGRFYTLREIPDFDLVGLWSCRAVHFSRHGNLLDTTRTLVGQAEAGYTASELDGLVRVEVKHSLLRLTRRGELARRRIGGRYVYLNTNAARQRQQVLMREERQAYAEVGAGLDVELLPEELKAAIILFFSLLNEKQRRCYAGVESAKLGYGGDRKIAEILGLDVHTVAKGRLELLGRDVEVDRVRAAGGGRTRVEKKLRK